ncbi:MAG: serine hydrolase domain-containing protein, partial [Bacteroidota bacterium]
MKSFHSFLFLVLPFFNVIAQDTLRDLSGDTTLYARLKTDVQQILTEGIQSGAFPGAQVMVVHEGEIVLHETAGFHTYDSLNRVQQGDIYDLASITKTSSALLVLMQQYENGNLELGEKLGELFPIFAGTDKADIPLRSALAHQARLRPWVPYWQGTLRGNARYPWKKRWNAKRTNDYRFKSKTLQLTRSDRYPIRLTDNLWLYRQFKERTIFKTIRKSPLEKEAGYRYSGILFYLLPDYVERSTNVDYRKYLRTKFYDPLGATTLGYRPLERGFSLDQIVPTEKDTFFRHQLLHGVVHDEGAAMMDGV